MGALIPAHITLVHRLADHLDADVVAQRLRGIPPIRVRITDMARWSGDEIGMCLAVDDIDGAIAALRESLEVVQPPGLDYLPHVTVLHPHTTAPATVDRAWTELGEWRPNAEVVIAEVHVIDVGGSGWRTLRIIPLTG